MLCLSGQISHSAARSRCVMRRTSALLLRGTEGAPAVTRALSLQCTTLHTMAEPELCSHSGVALTRTHAHTCVTCTHAYTRTLSHTHTHTHTHTLALLAHTRAHTLSHNVCTRTHTHTHARTHARTAHTRSYTWSWRTHTSSQCMVPRSNAFVTQIVRRRGEGGQD